MKHNIIMISLFIPLIVGCGSSSNGDRLVSISGTVSDRSFDSKSGAYDISGDSSLLLAVADQADICGMASSGEVPSEFQWLSVSLCIETGSEVGDYQVEEGNSYVPCQGKIAWAEIRQVSGGTPSVVQAGSGTVSLKTFTQNTISGNLQANFLDGGNIIGEFEVKLCEDLDK